MVRFFHREAIHKKNRSSQLGLRLPNTLPRPTIVTKTDDDIIKRANSEHPFLGRGSKKFIFSSSSQTSGIQLIEEYNEGIYQVLSHSKKTYIPPRENHKISPNGLLLKHPLHQQCCTHLGKFPQESNLDTTDHAKI